MRIIWVVLTACLLAACDLPQQAAELGGTSRDGKRVVQGYMEEVLNKDNWEAYETYFHKHIEFNGELLDRVGLRRMVASFRSAYPDFRLEIQDQIAEGDKVVTRVMITGTHLGYDEGTAPTGKKVRYQGIAIDRIKDGKIIELRFLGDVWGRLKQVRKGS